MAYVNIENLSFAYGETHVLDRVGLTMEKGEILAILGTSGSGKSTLLRTIAGLEVPKQGIIRVGDELFNAHRTFKLPEKREVGLVFQDYALFPHMSVRQNIMFGLHKMSKTERHQRLQTLLEMMAMADLQARYPHQLSGGQQQRVALARALAPMPKILLLDEPFSNIDTDLKHTIRIELSEILKKAGTTSILVTHDEADARMLANRILVLKAGKVSHIETLIHK